MLVCFVTIKRYVDSQQQCCQEYSNFKVFATSYTLQSLHPTHRHFLRFFGYCPSTIKSGMGMVQLPKQSKAKSTSCMRCFIPAMKVDSSQSPFSFGLQPLMPVSGSTASFNTQRMWLGFPLAGQDKTWPTIFEAKGAI